MSDLIQTVVDEMQLSDEERTLFQQLAVTFLAKFATPESVGILPVMAGADSPEYKQFDTQLDVLVSASTPRVKRAVQMYLRLIVGYFDFHIIHG